MEAGVKLRAILQHFSCRNEPGNHSNQAPEQSVALLICFYPAAWAVNLFGNRVFKQVENGNSILDFIELAVPFSKREVLVVVPENRSLYSPLVCDG